MQVISNKSKLDLHSSTIWDSPCESVEIKSLLEVTKHRFNMVPLSLPLLELSFSFPLVSPSFVKWTTHMLKGMRDFFLFEKRSIISIGVELVCKNDSWQ